MQRSFKTWLAERLTEAAAPPKHPKKDDRVIVTHRRFTRLGHKLIVAPGGFPSVGYHGEQTSYDIDEIKTSKIGNTFYYTMKLRKSSGMLGKALNYVMDLPPSHKMSATSDDMKWDDAHQVWVLSGEMM